MDDSPHPDTDFDSSSPNLLTPALTSLSPTTTTNPQTSRIDFSLTPLAKDYPNHYAATITPLLTPQECAHLYSLATSPPHTWTPATIRSGAHPQSAGIVATEARSCDRIFYHAAPPVAAALLERLKAALPEIVDLPPGALPHAVGNFRGGAQGWQIERLDRNFRFLRYGRGQYFREHCDAMFVDKEAGERSFFTVHLYLNGGEGGGGDATMEGGATTFHSMSLKERVDVVPVAGRALVFQQRGLLHSGQEVAKGVKYSMRTDVIYKKVD